MFSLSETEDGKSIYRCYGCGCESELRATDRVAAADEAITCNKAHKCALGMRTQDKLSRCLQST
jgi:hypothetical protein